MASNSSLIVESNGNGSFSAAIAPQLSEHSKQMMLRSSEQSTGCCFFGLCRPKPAPVHSHFKTRCTIFHDASAPDGIQQPSLEDSMYFFDAVQTEDEFDLENELYPIITTNTVPPNKHVRISEPETMLGHTEDGQVYKPASAKRLQLAVITTPPSSPRPKAAPSRRLLMSRMSSRFLRQKSATTMQGLQEPRIPIKERGYPGSLSPDELEECVSILLALGVLSRIAIGPTISDLTRRFCFVVLVTIEKTSLRTQDARSILCRTSL
jgi:hypothetical protein